MKEITVSPNHIVDSAAAFEAAVGSTFSPSEQAEYYAQPEEDLPRPSYDLFAAAALARNTGFMHKGGIKLGRANTDLLQGLDNLRVVIGVPSRDGAIAHFPGIVLSGPDGKPVVGFLRSDLITDGDTSSRLTSLQQTLLDRLYTMHSSNPSHNDDDRPQVNVAEIAHASLVASSDNPFNIHTKVHSLADDGNFAQKFTALGNLDIQSGHDTRTVKDHLVPANRVAELYVYRQHQLEQSNIHGLELTAGQMAVGLVLASAESRQLQIPLQANLSAVAEQIA